MPAKRALESTTQEPSPSKRPRIENAAFRAPPQLNRTPGWFDYFHSALSSIPQAMARPFKRQPAPMPGMEAHPRGSLANLMLQPRASRPRAPSVISLDDVSEVDPQEVRARKEQGAKRTEARRHLNDLAAPSIHPNLERPLFESAFANGHTTSLSHFTVAGPSTVASPSAEPGPSNRPDVSYTPRERTRAWTRQDSPSSSRSSGSTSSRSRSHPRSSLRSPASNISQLDFVSKLVDGAKSSGSPALPALERTRNQWLRANESRPVTKVDLSKPLKALQLDTRKPLDEAVARVEHKFEPPRTLIKPRPAPKPFEITKSDLLQRLKKQDEEVEKRLKNRFKKRSVVPAKLSDEQETIVKDRLRDSNFKAEKGNEQVDSNSLVRLRPGQWLNDDVINFYLELIKTRSKDQGGNVSSMNTFFYQKLSKDGYQSVRRWTKRLKLDIFSLDKLLIPINIQNMHWVCAVINFSARRIEYYDSMSDSGHRLEVFQNFRKYLDSEHRDKKGSPFDLTGWTDHFDPKTPRQNNGYDCGVFACQTLENAARGCDLVAKGFTFDGSNMEFFRRLMIMEIASGELSDRFWEN